MFQQALMWADGPMGRCGKLVSANCLFIRHCGLSLLSTGAQAGALTEGSGWPAQVSRLAMTARPQRPIATQSSMRHRHHCNAPLQALVQLVFPIRHVSASEVVGQFEGAQLDDSHNDRRDRRMC